MKKRKIVALCLFGVAVIAAAGAVLWQRDSLHTDTGRGSEITAGDPGDRAEVNAAPPVSQQTDDVLSGGAASQEVKDEPDSPEVSEKDEDAGTTPGGAPASTGEGGNQSDGAGTSKPPAGDNGAAPDTGAQGPSAPQTDAPNSTAPSPDETSPSPDAPSTDNGDPEPPATDGSDGAPTQTAPPTDWPPTREDEDSVTDTDPSESAPGGSGETARPGTEDQSELTADELVDACVAELYSCQADTMDTLFAMRDEILSEWRSLPAEERTDDKKNELALSGLSRCYKLEAETDSKVQGILDRYRTLLEDQGADTSALDDLWNQYVDKKAEEKAYYLDKYL